MTAKEVPLETALKGLPSRKITQLINKGFQTVDDLLRFLPRRHEDRSNVISDYRLLPNYIGQKITVAGNVEEVSVNYGKDILTVILKGDNGSSIRINWFHQNYLKNQIATGHRYVFYGKLHFSQQYGFDISAPSYFDAEIVALKTPLPIYGKIPGMSAEYLSECIQKALAYNKTVKCDDPIPEYLRAALNIDDWQTFLDKAHTPQTMRDVEDVSKRKIAEILLPFCMEMLERKYEVRTETDRVVDASKAEDALATFADQLPFPLTTDQAETLNQMHQVITSGRRLDALVQGDVGCGKTVIAEGITAMMLAAGYQTVIMAPTTVLAEQHYTEFSQRFSSQSCEVVFLGSGLKAKEKKSLLTKIKLGEAKIIVGTQAVISKDVEYAALGLTIADEEHRFGVNQRQALREKAMEGAHSISMSATPIPRSLALALYGDATTVYNIHTMPSGRKPVKTIAYSDEAKTYEALYRQIQMGRQGYVVCPLITSSDALQGVDSLEETLKKMQKFYKRYPEVKIACINGHMKEAEIKDILHAFANGEYHILLSTTIVEVGVNVPNASVMVIKNAERFGLAQLHQLRGRVGRGQYQSFCVLLSQEKNNPRIQAMVKTLDGFEIAKIDLEQRGMGNLVGTEQSGYDKAVNAMMMYNGMYEQINKVLDEVIQGKIRYDNTKKMVQALKGE